MKNVIMEKFSRHANGQKHKWTKNLASYEKKSYFYIIYERLTVESMAFF